MKHGDLVKSARLNSIGIVLEIFGDLDPGNPWVRVRFTHPKESDQWCKEDTLVVIQKGEGGLVDPLLYGASGGSGSL